MNNNDKTCPVCGGQSCSRHTSLHDSNTMVRYMYMVSLANMLASWMQRYVMITLMICHVLFN